MEKKLGQISLLFDANPLIQNKTGVGYFLENVVATWATNKPENLNIYGHYFNFLGKKAVPPLPGSPMVKYTSSKFFPTKLVGLMRRLGMQLPYEFFTRQRPSITLFTNFVSFPTIINTLNAVIIYDLSFVDCPDYVSDKNRAYLQKWVPISIKKADVIVTISEFTKQRIIDVYNVSPKNIYVTPIPPVSHVKSDTNVYAKHDIEKDYILFVGTIEPRKNLNTLLDAYLKLPDNLKNEHQLVLAGGKGWKDEEIVKKITQFQKTGLRIVSTGYVSDAEKSALYEGATICVLPSHYEGFGMPVLEAMSYGKPVLCSDLDVFKEIAGNSVEYFDTSNSENLSKKITEILSDAQKRNQLSKKSHELISGYSSWTEVTDGLYDFLLEKLKSKS